MEGVYNFMVFFIGLRALLKYKKDDDDMGKKRGKRKKKYQQNADWSKEDEANSVMCKSRKKDEEDKRKPFERITLPPPREAQEGHI